MEAVSFLFVFTMFFILIFIRLYELPSQNEWNPFGSYTPSMNNPRAGYIHVNADGFSLGMAFWTIFIPLKFRERFNLAE